MQMVYNYHLSTVGIIIKLFAPLQGFQRGPIALYTIYLFLSDILEAILNYRVMQGLPRWQTLDFYKLLWKELIFIDIWLSTNMIFHYL